MPNVATTKDFFAKHYRGGLPTIVSNKDFWQKIPPGLKILDVGCGLGHDIENLRLKYPEAEIVGVDRQPEMIEMFPEAILADATELPFADKEFDIAYANCVLCENPTREQIVKEMKRVALRVLICDVDREGNFSYATL